MKKILGLALLASLLVVSLAVAWNPPGGWDSWRQAMTTFGFSATDASKTTMNKGLLMPASAYVSFGTTYGTSGYGLRDNSGTPQYKASGGAWTDIGSGGGGGAVATDVIWDAAGDLVQGTGNNTAVKLPAGAAGKLLRAAGAGVAVDWSGYIIALPNTTNQILQSDGTNWNATSNPAVSTLNAYGAGVTVGTGSATTGLLQMKNIANNNIFTVQPGATGAALGWTLPIAAPGGANYLVNASTAGVLGYTNPASFVPVAGGTMTGGFVTMTPTTAGAGLNLPHGVAPSSPVNGDVWTTTTGLYARINSGTVGPFAAAGGSPALDDVTNPDAAKTFTLLDNNASALSFGATDKADILKIVTTDAGEGVTMSGYHTVTGLGTFGTLSSGATGFSVDADGDVTGKSFTTAKVNGTPGTSLLYEATTTETNGVGWKGPASRASDLYLQFSDSDPAINQFMLFPAPTTGTATGVWTTYGQLGALDVATTGIISGKIGVITKSSAYTLGTDAAKEAYGYAMLATGAMVLTLPAGVVGMSGCAYERDTAEALSVKPATDEFMVLNGVKLNVNHKVTSASGVGDYVCYAVLETGVWYVLGRSGTWIDGAE